MIFNSIKFTVTLTALFALTVLTAVSQGPAREVVYMDMEECLNYAYQNNITIRNSELDQKASKAFVGESISMGLPQIDAIAGMDYYIRLQQTFVENGDFITVPGVPEGEIITFPLGTKWQGNAAINFSQLLFDGSYFVGLQAAKAFKVKSEKDLTKTKKDVVGQVLSSYYAILVAEERMELLETEYERIDSLYNETQAMYENGFAERIDVSRIKVQLNNIAVQLKRTQDALVIAYAKLKFDMGMSPKTDLRIKEKLSDLSFSFDFTSVEEFDPTQRIEYKQLESNQDLAELDLKNNHAQYLPKLYLNAQLGVNKGAPAFQQAFELDAWRSYSLVGVSLSIPIFDGLQKSYKIQQNRIQLKQIENSYTQLKHSISLEIEDALSTLQTNIASLKLQKENMQLAEEVYDVSKLKYQEGVGSNIEVIDASSSFKEAETNYYLALYDALIAKVELEKALGILLEKYPEQEITQNN